MKLYSDPLTSMSSRKRALARYPGSHFYFLTMKWDPGSAKIAACAALFLAGMTSSIPCPAIAATPEELAKIQQNLTEKRQQDSELKKQLDKTEDELAELRTKLVKATREQEDSQDTLLEFQIKLDSLQKTEAEQRAALNKQQTHISDILVALLRMSRSPAELMIIQPQKPVDTIRGALLLRHALPQFAQEAQRLSTQLDGLDKTRAEIMDKQREIKDAQVTFTARQDELNTLLSQRRQWLKATESQRGDLHKQISELAKEAQNIQELMQKVAGSTLPLPEKLKKGGRISFTSPAKGRILYNFGQADDVGSASRGLTMRTRAGEMIVAPADGQVVFAGPFKGYGNILIIRHGDDYHSFLAGFGRMDSAVGQVVNAGEPLGRSSMEQGASAQLYFELRYKGAPINPAQFVKTNVAKN